MKSDGFAEQIPETKLEALAPQIGELSRLIDIYTRQLAQTLTVRRYQNRFPNHYDSFILGLPPVRTLVSLLDSLETYTLPEARNRNGEV